MRAARDHRQGWLTVQDPRLKRRRLDNPDDFLRLEVATALKSERIRVIPVLVERSLMPAPEDLPPDLADLAFRNALELSDTRWESDVGSSLKPSILRPPNRRKAAGRQRVRS